MSNLEKTIQQSKALSMQARTDINLMLTSSESELLKRRLLKSFGISWQQFNILRILKGQKGKPAPLMLLTERMIDQTSNTSRLIDKLEAKGLVERISCPMDRRRVEISILPAGLTLIDNASKAMEAGIQVAYRGMQLEELQELNTLMDKLRKSLIDNHKND